MFVSSYSAKAILLGPVPLQCQVFLLMIGAWTRTVQWSFAILPTGECEPCRNATLSLAAPRGRIAAQSEVSQTRRSETQLRHRAEMDLWNSSDPPTWLNERFYLTDIQPRLPRITLSELSAKLGVSIPHAVDLRSARRVPHKRHWQALAQLVGASLPLKLESRGNPASLNIHAAMMVRTVARTTSRQ